MATVGSVALAQTNLKIGGTLEDAAGAPVTGATVVLTPIDASGTRDDRPVTRVKSNKKGRFAFGFSKPGDYLLSVEAEGLQLQSATVRMRTAERKPVYTPDGPLEDVRGTVDPANPVVALGIPGEAYTVDLDLVLAEPAELGASTAAAADIGAQLVASDLGQEVEALVAKLDARQYPAVASELETLLAENPDQAALHYLYGYTLVKLERVEDAEKALREALRLTPDLAGASGLLGQVLAEEGRFEEAVTAIRHELDLADPTTPRAPLLLTLGQALLELDRVDEAVPALEECWELDPANELTRVQLVDAYVRSGKNEQAEHLLGEGLDPESAAILHFNLAANLLRSERWEEGAEHMRQALAKNPGLSEAHRFLAQAYLALGKQADAVEEFKVYIAAVPDAADAAQIEQLIKALQQQ